MGQNHATFSTLVHFVGIQPKAQDPPTVRCRSYARIHSIFGAEKNMRKKFPRKSSKIAHKLRELLQLCSLISRDPHCSPRCPGYQRKGQFNGYLMCYVRSAPKSVETSKIRIGNVLLYFIKKAKNSMGFFFW